MKQNLINQLEKYKKQLYEVEQSYNKKRTIKKDREIDRLSSKIEILEAQIKGESIPIPFLY